MKANGTSKEIMAETAALIAVVHQNLNNENPEAAKGYKNALIGVLLDPDSPVWKGEGIC